MTRIRIPRHGSWWRLMPWQLLVLSLPFFSWLYRTLLQLGIQRAPNLPTDPSPPIAKKIITLKSPRKLCHLSQKTMLPRSHRSDKLIRYIQSMRKNNQTMLPLIPFFNWIKNRFCPCTLKIPWQTIMVWCTKNRFWATIFNRRHQLHLVPTRNITKSFANKRHIKILWKVRFPFSTKKCCR